MLIIYKSKTLKVLVTLLATDFIFVKGGQSSLHVAARKGDIEAMHLLIDANMDLDAQDMVRKWIVCRSCPRY